MELLSGVYNLTESRNKMELGLHSFLCILIQIRELGKQP